VFNPKKQNFV